MNLEQQVAYNSVMNGHNTFITGSAGTGKSYVIDMIKKYANENNKNIMITGLTGVSASLLGGRTIHSALMLGLGKKSVEDIVKNIRIYKKAQTWIDMDILVIDEISMMSADLYVKISDVLGIIRRRQNIAFGGIQLVLCGDFAQLNPVEGEFCFKSDLWPETITHTIILKKLMRQQYDEPFQELLEKARMGKCPRASWDLLVSRMGQPIPEEIEPTVLFSTRRSAENINHTSYQVLKDSGAIERVYKTVYDGKRLETVRNWAKQVDIPEEVALCIGAQVVVTSNVDIENGIVNGTRGIVVHFLDDGVKLQLINGRHVFIGKKKQIADDNGTMFAVYIPLALAWALTIHKSQGMTLDCAAIDLGPSVFAYGQAYTALSRVRNLNSLYIMDVAKASFKIHPDVKIFYGWNVPKSLTL